MFLLAVLHQAEQREELEQIVQDADKIRSDAFHILFNEKAGNRVWILSRKQT